MFILKLQLRRRWVRWEGSGSINNEFDSNFVNVFGSNTLLSKVALIMHTERFGGRLKRESWLDLRHNFKWVIDGGKFAKGNGNELRWSNNNDKEEGRWSSG